MMFEIWLSWHILTLSSDSPESISILEVKDWEAPPNANVIDDVLNAFCELDKRLIYGLWNQEERLIIDKQEFPRGSNSLLRMLIERLAIESMNRAIMDLMCNY
ncbi:hypothetical protein ACFE04_018261 [Oxalis oulophora]